VVVRVMKTLLLNFGLDFTFQVSYRAVARVLVYLYGHSFLVLCFVLASWCASIFHFNYLGHL